MKMTNLFKLAVLSSLSVAMMACDKTDRSFSIAPGSQSFEQTAEYVPRKMDILWIIDNSGSMESSQTALTQNFQSFIERFQTLGYDFHMAVQTSDAFLGKFRNEPNRRRVKDGRGSNHSGVFVMDKNTPNLADVFMINATQGINGSGDERAFSSFEDTLDYAGNSDFRRPDAFLAIIIVSDEDDFSATIENHLNNNYNHPSLIPVSHYVDFLNDFTAGPQDYSVHAITIMDVPCLNLLNAEFGGRLIGQRYMELAALTGGLSRSLCSDFGASLADISESIVRLVSKFKLSREPYPETIRVKVNGVVIPNDPVNGWTYEPSTWEISFSESATPPAGADVKISFEPKTIAR